MILEKLQHILIKFIMILLTGGKIMNYNKVEKIFAINTLGNQKINISNSLWIPMALQSKSLAEKENDVRLGSTEHRQVFQPKGSSGKCINPARA